MARWRFSFYKLVPSWLSSGDGERVRYALGRLVDGFIERARRSAEARLPSRSGPTGLALLGAQRGIVQGRSEDPAGYARRLSGWRGIRGHQVRGNPFATAFQIWNYFGGICVKVIDNKGNVYTTALDGTESATHGGSWNWDGGTQWWRFWLRLGPVDPNFIVQTEAAADVPLASVGMSGMNAADAAVMRNLFQGDHPWKMAGTRPEWLIVATTGVAVVPDGTWSHWSKSVGGVQVQARPTTMRFVSLNPKKNNAYSGTPGNYPKSVTVPAFGGGGTYAGTPGVFPASLTLPGGGVYQGVPAANNTGASRFPATIQLIDDGSNLTK
jgi:hypothetical protein